MQKFVESVVRVTDVISGISAAANEQSIRISQLNSATTRVHYSNTGIAYE
ncbi:hypothetical protein KO116_03870 [Halomonas sp. KO116]|nr:hypothetical protein KO116_03870 [Halomonas sp. KO116]